MKFVTMIALSFFAGILTSTSIWGLPGGGIDPQPKTKADCTAAVPMPQIDPCGNGNEKCEEAGNSSCKKKPSNASSQYHDGNGDNCACFF